MATATKTPPHETAAGRKKLAAKGQTAYGTSYPVPNVSYLKKALKAVGRVAPGKRATLGRFLRKRARTLGATSVIKGSWADNTQGAKAMANTMREALELARQGGYLYEDLHGMRVLEFVGPKGYEHGWIYVGGKGLPSVKPGEHVRVDQMAGKQEGQIVSRTGDRISVKVRKGTQAGKTINVHAGMVSHKFEGKGAPPIAEKTPAASSDRAALVAHMMDVHQIPLGATRGRTLAELHQDHHVDHQSVISRQRGLSNHDVSSTRHRKATKEMVEKLGGGNATPGEKKTAPSKPALRIAGQRMTPSQENAFNGLSETNKDVYEERRQSGLGHADAMKGLTPSSSGVAPLPPHMQKNLDAVTPAQKKSAAAKLGGVKSSHYQAYMSRRSHGYSHKESMSAGLADRQQKPTFDSHSDAALMGYTDRSKYNVARPSQKTFEREGAGSPNAQPPRTRSIAKERMASPEGKQAAARVAPAMRAQAATKEPVGSTAAHSELLKARTAARAAYPQGHPERLKAERAVRQSRKARRAGAEGGGGTPRVRAGTPGTSRRRRTAAPVGVTSAPERGGGKSIAQRQAEAGTLLPRQQRTYRQAMLKGGVGHERSLGVAKERPIAARGSAGRKKQIAEEKAAAPGRAAARARVKAANVEAKAQANRPIVSQESAITTLIAGLVSRGWSKAQARKLAEGRILRGVAIPQYAPGKKGPRAK